MGTGSPVTLGDIGPPPFPLLPEKLGGNTEVSLSMSENNVQTEILFAYYLLMVHVLIASCSIGVSD